MNKEAYKAMLAKHRFEKELGEKAMRSYFRKYGKDAVIPSSPRFDYQEDGVRVILENVNGILATYFYNKGGTK
jgi:chitinase